MKPGRNLHYRDVYGVKYGKPWSPCLIERYGSEGELDVRLQRSNHAVIMVARSMEGGFVYEPRERLQEEVLLHDS